MSSEKVPVVPVPQVPLRNVPVPFSSASQAASQSGLWDRISTWASEHKAVVYTVAGVAIVVTGAGVAYYLTESVGRITPYFVQVIHVKT
jgi:mitochondrial import receptor subunit TOM70